MTHPIPDLLSRDGVCARNLHVRETFAKVAAVLWCESTKGSSDRGDRGGERVGSSGRIGSVGRIGSGGSGGRLAEVRVEWDDGSEPLVSTREIAILLPHTSLYRVTCARVAVRAEPSTSAKLLGLRMLGEEVQTHLLDGTE